MKTKVQPIKPTQPTIEPPAGWEQKTAFGFMGFDGTPAGRLVRLADVLRWLGTHPSPKPHAAALAALCDAMPGDVMQWLYQLQPNDYAKPMPVDHMFGYKTAAQIAMANANARQAAMQRAHKEQQQNWGGFRQSFLVGNAPTTTKQPEPIEPGLPALRKHIGTVWRLEVFRGVPAADHAKVLASFWAIPIDKAAQHWGYGRVLGAVVSESVLPLVWTGEQLAAQIAVFKANGHRDYAKQTWVMAGIKERDGRRLVQEYEKSISPQAVSSVFLMGKQVAKKATKRA